MENRYFQWVVSEKRGQVVIFDKIETEDSDVFIVFKDKSRINENFVAQLNQQDLTGKLMAEVDSPTNIWKFKEEWVGREEEVWVWKDETNPIEKVCVQPFVEGRKVVKLIAPRPTPKKTSNFGQISNTLPNFQYTPPAPETPKNTVDKSDPIYILISKAKKVDTEVNMKMEISLPPKNLYDIAKESFENGDEKFINYIVDEIEIDEIKDALKIALKEMYEPISDINI